MGTWLENVKYNSALCLDRIHGNIHIWNHRNYRVHTSKVSWKYKTKHTHTAKTLLWYPDVMWNIFLNHRETLGPDIFNMALALHRQMNAEMRHVALAEARVPVKRSYQGS